MNNIASLAKAYSLAAHWHSTQRRKGNAAEPYVNHLAEVAHLIAETTGDVDITIAAVLHDAIEDAGVTAAQIEVEFGARVAVIVLEVTDDKSQPKAERKRLQVETTPSKSPAAKMLKLADKTSNLRAILHSPPAWPHERKVEYLAWARRVVSGARCVSPQLEEIFDAAAQDLEGALAAKA